jgi:hypothetical protein
MEKSDVGPFFPFPCFNLMPPCHRICYLVAIVHFTLISTNFSIS